MLSPVDIPSLLNDRKKWRKENPLYLVRLNKAQKRFMDCVTQDGKLPRRIIFCGSNKIGKEINNLEPIVCNRGEIRFGDLRLNDQIYTQSGELTTVVGVFPQGVKPLYRVSFDDSTSLLVGLEHRWRVRSLFGSRKWCVMTTQELLAKGLWYDKPKGERTFKWAIPTPEPLQYDTADLPVDPYVLGIWLGDGDLQRGSSARCGFGSMFAWEEAARRGYDHGKIVESSGSWKGVFYGLGKVLRDLGFCSCKARAKRIPKQYFLGSIEQRLDLLRGLMDTDGHALKRSGASFVSTSPWLAKAVRKLALSLGFKVYIGVYTAKCDGIEYGKAFRVTLQGPMNPFLRPDRSEAYRCSSYTHDRIVRDIKYVRDGAATCISVSHPSEQFVVGHGFTVTLNTTMGAIRGTCLALGEHPFLSDNHVFRDLQKLGWPVPNVGLVAGETLTQTINQKLAPEYTKWIPKICEPTFRRNGLGVTTSITLHKDLHGNPLGSQIFFRCYSDDTEVLTQEGWKLFKDVPVGSAVMTMRLSDGVLEWQQPIAAYSYDYTGPMIGTGHSRLDFLVTPTHNMVVNNYCGYKSRGWLGAADKYILKPAAYLAQRDSVPACFGWEGQRIDSFTLNYKGEQVRVVANDYLALVGMFLSEGHASQYEVSISQYDVKKKDLMRVVLDRLPFKYVEGAHGFRFFSKDLAEHFQEFGGLSDTKFIPCNLKDLCADQLRVLLYWMCLGDGSVYRGKQGDVNCLDDFRCYNSKSKQLIDDFQECLLKVGMDGKIHVKVSCGVYYCTIWTGGSKAYVWSNKDKKNYLHQVPYMGKVYCLEVANHTLITRRNGRVLCSGNSYESQVDSFEGIDYNWIHWDEPPPNNIFVAAERGLMALNGISYLTFTSLKEPWLNDLASESIDYGGSDPTVRVIEGGDIWNALKENGGHLDRDAIEAFIRICPPEEYDTRILGKWMESGGRIYGGFRDSFPYVVPPFEIPPDWQWYEALDPADGKHSKWLFVAVAPYDVNIFKQNVGRLFVADWLSFPPGTLITDMVKMVKRKRLELDYEEPVEVVLDAKFGRRRVTTLDRNEPQRWEEKLIDAGAGYVKLSHSAPGDVDVGHNIVREYLKPQLWSFAMNEEQQEVPGLVFFSTCRGKGGPIEAMLKYKRQLKSTKPEETYKDWPDAIRYICMEYPKVTRVVRARRSESGGKQRNKFTGV